MLAQIGTIFPANNKPLTLDPIQSEEPEETGQEDTGATNTQEAGGVSGGGGTGTQEPEEQTSSNTGQTGSGGFASLPSRADEQSLFAARVQSDSSQAETRDPILDITAEARARFMAEAAVERLRIERLTKNLAQAQAMLVADQQTVESRSEAAGNSSEPYVLTEAQRVDVIV